MKESTNNKLENALLQSPTVPTTLVSTAAVFLAMGAGMIDGCTAHKPSVEYAEGLVTVAVDPAQKAGDVRKITREQVLAQLGAAREGKQDDGSYVICADMSSVYSCQEPGCVDEENKKRLAGKFEMILLDQAAYLLAAEKCSRFTLPDADRRCERSSGFAIPADCVLTENKLINPNGGTVNGLGIHKTRTDGDFVCLWTTPSAEINCR